MQVKQAGKGTLYKCQSGVEAEEICILKEEADSINAEHLPETARGVFQELFEYSSLECLSFHKPNTTRKVCTECFCYWSLWYTPELQRIQTCARPSSKILLSSDTHKKLPPPAKPSRQREPFTGVAFHSPVLIPFWHLQAVYSGVQAVSGTSAKSLLRPG